MSAAAGDARASSLRSGLDRITQLIATIGFTCLVGIALLTMFDATMRWWSMPRIPGFRDYTEVFFAVVIASCFPAGLMRGHNVTVRFLGRGLGARAAGWLEVWGALLTLVFFVLLVWQFFLHTADLTHGGRVTGTISLPVAPWWWVVTAIMTLCVPVQVFVLVERTRAALRGAQTGPIQDTSL